MECNKRPSYTDLPQLNSHLDSMRSDFLDHLGISIPNTKETTEIENHFGDVRFVVLGGTRRRVLIAAQHFQNLWNPCTTSVILQDFTSDNIRYSMFKVGPVLCVSHGIGIPSISILLHELFKLFKYAKCNPVIIRIGTCGGLNITPGTIVVSKDVYNGYLRNELEVMVLGKPVTRPARFHRIFAEEMVNVANSCDSTVALLGNTYCVNGFYEGQARLDGAFCHFEMEDKEKFFERLSKLDIRNIEMETLALAALTNEVGLKSAALCVAVVDRMKGDQILHTKQQIIDMEFQLVIVVAKYIKQCLNLPDYTPGFD